jgi:hypothetical protein
VNWRITALCALILGPAIGSTAGLPGSSQPQTKPSRSQQTAVVSARAPYQRQEPWYDIVLKRLNPDEVDYGRWIERERRVFIDSRIKNPCFLYSLCTTLVSLLMALVCTKLRIDHRRAMWITAEMMADIYSQDAYSRRIAQEAIEKYNTHIERCNRAIEAAEHGEAVSAAGSEIERLRGELICVAGERDTATRERDLAREELHKRSEILAEMSIRLEAFRNKSGATGDAKRTSDSPRADAKLVTPINHSKSSSTASETTTGG